jgi:hypothetical protein
MQTETKANLGAHLEEPETPLLVDVVDPVLLFIPGPEALQ